MGIPKEKVRDEELTDKILQFVIVGGVETLNVNWTKGKLAHEIEEQWGFEGLGQLQDRSGLDANAIQQYIAFYRTFADKKWHSCLVYEFHRVLAWHYQAAVARNPTYKDSGRLPFEWLDFAEREKLPLSVFQTQLEYYYGARYYRAPAENLRVFAEVLRLTPHKLHPCFCKELEEAARRAEQAVAQQKLAASLQAESVLNRNRGSQQGTSKAYPSQMPLRLLPGSQDQQRPKSPPTTAGGVEIQPIRQVITPSQQDHQRWSIAPNSRAQAPTPAPSVPPVSTEKNYQGKPTSPLEIFRTIEGGQKPFCVSIAWHIAAEDEAEALERVMRLIQLRGMKSADKFDITDLSGTVRHCSGCGVELVSTSASSH
ncbi:MAG: hypothetical protein AAB701_01150, partial [Patescibacteria group bacterium]